MSEQTFAVRYDEGTPPSPFVEAPAGDGKRLRATLVGGEEVRLQIRMGTGTLRQGPQVPLAVAEEIPAMLEAIREHTEAESAD